MKMAIGTTKFCKCFQDLRQSYVLHSISSSQTLLEESIQAAIKTKTYHQIPDLLSSTITPHSPPPRSRLPPLPHPPKPLCAVDQWTEAVRVLKEMGGAGCEPDSESYSIVIGKMCERRKSGEAVELVKEMVGEIGLTPKQGVLVRVVAGRGGVEMIEFLERRGCNVGFESYEMVVEGCLERGEFVLGGKVVMATLYWG
ncbi:hypothetical protein HHK36_013369 [Tetracentron sinense]|uniref:Pentatricopeptide repeat-containing protein n=1 Tax=Tetracentron sinense TaxID=13715 RepID=A0A834Z6G1_TETSI|nr:hypothetical protein HHK36_013369 [Tetracentron sinense]